jgi:hypothetical protein
MEGPYHHPAYIEMAKRNAIPADRLSTHARELHRNPEVVADLIFAHEVDPSNYSDEDFRNLGNLVSRPMYKISQESKQDSYSWMMDHFAMSDVNRWYLKEVMYGEKTFEDALSQFLQMSPPVKRDAGP